MNLCIFSRPFYPAIGGLESIAQILALQFSESGHNVEVVTDTPTLSEEDDLKFPFKITRTGQYRVRIQAFKRADIVLFMNVSLHGIFPVLVAGVPTVLSHHGIYGGNSLRSRLLAFCKRRLTLFYPNISVSEYVARHIPAASVIVPNAYDNTLFTSQRLLACERDFVFCGRLVSDKGADVLIDAYKRVVKLYPKATLTIIGDGPEKADLEEMSRTFDNINFTGILRGQQLVNTLKEHSCMVIPSLWEEPFGIVALEGIASCDTVISSNRGGLPEAVGDCGILVSPTVDALAQAMISVLKAREQGDVIPGQPSDVQRAAHLERHAPQHVAQRYLDVCRKAIQQ